MTEWARTTQEHEPREAARRWAIIRGKFPEQEEGYMLGALALDVIGETEAARQVRSQRPAECA